MKNYKKMFTRLLLAGECLASILWYLCSSQGLRAEQKILAEIHALETEISQLTTEITHIQTTTTSWQNYPWYTEKFAREQLHMARPHEEIYIL